MTKTLTFRVHQNAIERLDHFRRLLYFKNRSDMVRCALVEGVYNTIRKNKKLRGKLNGKTNVIGCRLPDDIHQLILEMNRKQRDDTVSVWAAIAVYDWIEQIEKADERNMKSPVYPGLCQDFTHTYRPRIKSLLMELNRLAPVK